VFRYS
jgi:hypothetical protein